MLLLMLFTMTQAQNKSIIGKLIDRDTKEAVMMTTIQLLKTDSSFVKGVLSDENGNFKINAPENGKYILKFTNIGYTSFSKNVTISQNKDINLGELIFGADAIMLKEATVIGQAAKVVVKEDTFIYNASAYRTPEGSVVEELVKKLPGAQVDDDGKITINGKEVKKIMVDGKEFMTGDTKTAMKNLPVSIIEKIRTYEEKSDLAKVTGIDDGEEETVLDFGIKKGMNKGFMSNIDLAAGTHDRYAERLMGGYFNDKTKLMLFANANNTNDQGFPGGGGGGRFGANRNGLNTSKMVGVNINHIFGDKLELNGSVRWNHNNGDVRSEQSTESFLSNIGAFSNSINQNYSRNNNWNANFRLEWKPDSMTNILFRPTFSLSRSDGSNYSTSASYNEDPYLYVTDPLAEEYIEMLANDSLMVNTQRNRSLSYSDNKTVSAMLQYNRKLNTKGRNITLRTRINYSDGESKSMSMSDVHLYMIQNTLGNDSTYQTNRYSITPTKSINYNIQATYSEPIFKSAFLQFNYRFTYKYNKSDKSTFDLFDAGDSFFNNDFPKYRGWDSYFALLNNPLDYYLDTDLSRYSEYKNYIHDFQLTLRVIKEKYRLNAGVMIQPQRTNFIQNYQGVKTDTTRNVVNIAPTIDFRYRFSKLSQLRIRYRGTSSQPSMSDLLDITDDSNPLNIKKGNPGLKPSFTNNLNIFYNNYIQKKQRAIMANLNYSNTRNSISNMVTYDEKTGGRTTRPENINGNWNISGGFMFNTALDSVGRWNVNTHTTLRYNNYVNYLSIDNTSNSQKNTTRTTTLGERLAGSYRIDWLEVELDGSMNYTHTKNLLQSENDLDTWQFAYGGTINIYLPWGTSISTDMHQNSRRGYNDDAANTNELIWNAQISQGFLKGKALNVSLQFYDILKRQSNFSRSINAMQRSDTWYNSVNSYAMLHVIYKLNMFGGKNARNQNKQMRPDNRNGRMPMGGFQRGGSGGGRPMM